MLGVEARLIGFLIDVAGGFSLCLSRRMGARLLSGLAAVDQGT